jgi:hypothetical protein
MNEILTLIITNNLLIDHANMIYFFTFFQIIHISIYLSIYNVLIEWSEIISTLWRFI